MSALTVFRAVRTVGTALPAEALPRANELRMPGQTADAYQLSPGMAVNGAIARAWEAMLAAHRSWCTALERLPDGDAATKLTRDKWLLPLLYELGWGRPDVVNGGLPVPPGLGETEAPHFPISHRVAWPDAANASTWAPLHLVGAGIDLDTKTAGVTARAPQAMVQDYLNRDDHALWAIVSNGHQLRLLRDASSLTRQSFVEFDLDAIFADQLYADFRILFLTVHASRFAPHLDDKAAKAVADSEDAGEDAEVELAEPKLDNCWLERWRTTAIDDGARALLNLQHGIAVALQELGTGFVSHPANATLRETLAAATDADRDLQRALLRIAYRLIVLFVVEDRDLLHRSDVPVSARTLYADYFSTARLRRLAAEPIGGWHTDLWQAHQIVTDALAGDGLPALGLSGLGASLFSRDALSILDGAELPNRALLAAVRALAQINDPVTELPRPVDYRNLDSEELGGMYEGLLAYTPRYHADERVFTLEVSTGNERKKSGSYYTPSDLIALVLDEALNPLIDEAVREPDPQQALLDLTVVDPACGSGHFVVATARRIAAALATVRTEETEPTPAALRAATADVIERCVYGVDLNDLAIEITKVALWLEAFDADRPFPFLDAHFRVGNALLGTTPELLRHNIPDTAFVALGDDDKDWTKKLKARNKTERQADQDQLTLSFGPETLNVETSQFTKAAREADTGTVASVAALRARADAWRRLEADPDLVAAKLVADAWCAAFVQHKTGATTSGQGITHATVRVLSETPESVPDTIVTQVNALARQYRFFHWHLEFPGVFTVRDDGSADAGTGWTGGFSCVVGNPPWERVKIQDKEFFGNAGRPDIEGAATAAIRKKMIDKLAETDPDLHHAYLAALRQSDGTAHLLLKSGRYPFTGQGDVNTYSVFAETMRTVTNPEGAAGIITPTGLATDKTTAPFFADTLTNHRLYAFYDFDNEAKIFRDVHHSYRFAVTTMTGTQRTVQRTKFAFLNRHISDVPEKRFQLAAKEVLALNPNTGTLPMFRSRKDADITLGIYSRHPVLIRDDDPDGNPWGLSFARLFDMANDSGLFHTPDDLADAKFNGWSYTQGNKEYVPLYEAKMLSHFDHRFSTYRGATQAQLNVGSLPRPTDEQHDDPAVESLARYWVERSEVEAKLKDRWDQKWLLGWRDIARASDSRTFVPSVFPASAVGNKFPVAFPVGTSAATNLHGLWSTMVFDYVARQKLSGTGMTYFIVKQLACPSPGQFESQTPWRHSEHLETWLKPYVLELAYTSSRLHRYAQDMGDDGPPFRWDPDRRALLRADLDAGFLHIYGLDRYEAEHVLDSFPVIRKYDERDFGEYRTKRLVLEAYDRMAEAIANGGKGWKPLADPPAGDGPRHHQ
ncbi:restriction endonuclease [Mycobacteroides abscessus]|uniref:Eco57I restriction-modification methylase domain-containing protein n=1 Tax=Mycobacteroides abscessus TaxID=36809 RepID=UPI000E67BFB1|nr:DNA methyltransferase [Mycobacteroides abscessus]MDO3140323.1 N-6 DNA methylase [Mycobacteroides abscessus subsp. abscessus]MDO3154217.1 N-6 DNA methylase [Mycobacteroides abscessus subsp. abscessus]RIR33747.1 restriction endonuclease [Mycobacteroides abscessus]RIR38966.1 restriction endonuclease [Mycobacteroides abscessus]RIT55815.1 restriction endonuclease [Mycobacteroides abscessus]